MLNLKNCLFAAVLGLVMMQAASAHFLWVVIEPAGQTAGSKAKVYFSESAEPDDPKLLDKVTKAESWSLASDGVGRRAEATALTLKKVDDALEAELTGQPTTVILKHNYGVISKGGESFLLQYYAKTYSSVLPGNWTSVKDAEKLPLEIVPSRDGSTTVLKALWKGEPVQGVTMVVVGPGLTKVELTTDDKGLARCSLPQAGLFSIRAKHSETAKGELAGQAYTSIRHYSTLALRFAPDKVSPAAVKLPALPKGTTSFGGAVVGDTLYLYGGNYGGSHQYANEDQSGDLWKLDLKTAEKWEQAAGGPRLQGLAMVEYKGKLYRVGGFTAMNKQGEKDNLRSQSDFASYDPQTNTWTSLVPMPEPRSSHDAAVVGDTLYVVGGWNMQGEGGSGANWHDSALSLNLASDKPEWKLTAAPPFKRRALALAAFQGKLYCVGGMQEKGGTTTAVAVFDPAANAWADAPALLGGSMDGFGASVFACRDSLFATTMSGSIQRLAAKGTSWEYQGQLAHPRFFHRLLPWQADKLVVVGGSNMSSGKTEELEVLPIAAPPATAAVGEK